jgi:ribosomal subunit interface protein
MQLSVKGKQIDVGDSLRRHVAASLETIVDKYAGRAIECSAVFSRDAYLFCADLSVHVRHDILVQAHASAPDAYTAFDAAAERIAKRLRRHKRRLNDHRERQRAVGDEENAALTARAYVLAAPGPEEDAAEGETVEAADDQPVVVAETALEVPMLTVGEAVMRLDLADVPALFFKNRAHGGINAIYRRRDGHIGWLDPHLSASGDKRGPVGNRKG